MTPDLQQDALRLFLALRLHRPAWAGALLFCVGLDKPGRALALASLAAGAAALFVEPDTGNLRMAQREGCCTFTVTSLAEAIRILKNEVRQGHTITVALRSPVAEALHETLRRGLQPQALTCSRVPGAEEWPLAQELIARGADALTGLGLLCGRDAIHLDATLAAALQNHWMFDTDHAPTRTERAASDAAWLVPGGSTHGSQFTANAVADLAAQWLQVAPSLFPRALSRAVLRRR